MINCFHNFLSLRSCRRIQQFFLQDFIWYLLACALLAWMFKDYFFTSTVLGGVAPFHFDLAEKTWFFQNIRSGHLYWLYPQNELGHFVATNPASGLLFLPNFLYALFDSHHAQKFLFIFHYLILLSGLASLLKHFGSKQQSYVVALLGISLGLSASLPLHVALPYVSFFPWSISMTRNLWLSGHGVLKSGLAVAFVFLLGDPLMAATGAALGSLLGWCSVSKPKRPLNLAMAAFAALIVCSPHLLAIIMDAKNNSRALGISSYEALSYSTAPIRILDWLFPIFNLYQKSDYLGIGFHSQWWFPRIGGGLILTGLMIFGFCKFRGKARWCILLPALFFINLSLGQFSVAAEFIFEYIPPISWTRFPERYLNYAWPLLMIFVLKGLEVLPKKIAFVLCLIALIENVTYPLELDLLKISDLKSDLPSEHWVGDNVHPTRFLTCERGARGDEALQYYDVRGYGLNMVNGTSNTRSAGLKFQGCPSALSVSSQKWLGWTHAIVPDQGEMLTPTQYPGLSQSRSFSAGQIWESKFGSPLHAYWVDRPVRGKLIENINLEPSTIAKIERASKGEMFVDVTGPLNKGTCDKESLSLKAGPGGQSFEVEIPDHCHGLLALPWAMHWGWKTTPYVPINTGNSAILVLDIPPELRRVTLSFTPPWMNLTAVFSIFAQLLFGLIILISQFKHASGMANVFDETLGSTT